jgi:hypothetical protein
MPECSCASCRASRTTLGRLTSVELAELRERLAGLSRFLKENEWEDLDLSLDEPDADVMSSIMAVFSGESSKLAVRQRLGVEIAPADAAAAQLRIRAQLDEGLALLSPSASTRLAPVLGQLNDLLADMTSLSQNPIQFGAYLQNLLRDVAISIGPAGPEGFNTGGYSPYEWSRLCRTEAVFARSAAEREYLQQEWEASPEALDAHGWPPIHPQCMCAVGVWTDADGKAWMILETTPTACEECNDVADLVASSVGAM